MCILIQFGAMTMLRGNRTCFLAFSLPTCEFPPSLQAKRALGWLYDEIKYIMYTLRVPRM